MEMPDATFRYYARIVVYSILPQKAGLRRYAISLVHFPLLHIRRLLLYAQQLFQAFFRKSIYASHFPLVPQ